MAHILIVDDRPYVREFFSEELAHEGYQVESVGDAASTWGYLKDSRPDLVLLDLYLNGFEGRDVLRDMERKYPNLPVMILTAKNGFSENSRLSLAHFHVIKRVLLLLMDACKK